MTRNLIWLLIFLSIQTLKAQTAQLQIDSLHKALAESKSDTGKIDIWNQLATYYQFSRPDSGIYYSSKSLTLSRNIELPKGELGALVHLALSYQTLGDDAKSLAISLEGVKRAEENRDLKYKANFLLHNGVQYHEIEDFDNALVTLKQSYSLFYAQNDFGFMTVTEAWIGITMARLGELDSAFYYLNKALNTAEMGSTIYGRESLGNMTYLSFTFLGNIHRYELHNTDSAILYFKKALSSAGNLKARISDASFSLAQQYHILNDQDSVIFYADMALSTARQNNLLNSIIEISKFQAGLYEKKDPVKALEYSQLAVASIDSLEKLKKYSSYRYVLDYDEKQRRFEVERATTAFQNKSRQNSLVVGLGVALIIGFILFRNNRQQQRSNQLLSRQKEEINESFTKLKSTQSQLIHSEKMASLGELTAGIAHEIQNPLNFVNNFSEVSAELVDEMNEEMDKGNSEEAKQIGHDLKQNLEKINHHGKRAGDIVKGMLQHSQSSSGKKEPTNINALADEYLRLAYHGLRAKDKSFNATMKTDFDESIGNINIIPQDIGRVILNLITNAFYAVNEKSKQSIAGYEPIVEVSTKKEGDKILISVKDNGNGIPDSIKEKIFQPFFTTKPTGQGTGLGLSLSYDIVKAHGGQLNVETKEARPDDPVGRGEGSSFTIQLPIT